MAEQKKSPPGRTGGRNPFETPKQVSPSLERQTTRPRQTKGQPEQPETAKPKRSPFDTSGQVSPALRPDQPRRSPFGPAAQPPPESTVREERPPAIEQAVFLRKSSDTRKRPVVPSFRGIPLSLKQKVDEAAAEREVPIGLLARLMIETSLAQYWRGELPLAEKVRLTPRGWTLYPTGKNQRHRGRPPGSQSNKGKSAPTKKRHQVAFRGVTVEHREQLFKVAEDLKRKTHAGNLAVGEIARALLENGLKLHKANQLPPITSEMITAFMEEFGTS